MAEPSIHAEAHSIVASAREILAELEEEGVDAIRQAELAEPGFVAPESEAGEGPRAVARSERRSTRAEEPDTRAASSARAEAEAPRTRGAGGATTVPRESEPVERATLAPVEDWGPEPTLEAVQGVLGDCRRCGLCEGRSTIVFGSGKPDADLMFIGEGPGEQEDRQGLPFVGRAGELLTQMIEKGIGTPRSDVYICNIVKCRPHKNRNPLPDEVAACRPFLDGQIDAVRPKVIVSLGKPAASLLLDRNVAITRERGTWQSYRGIPLMPTLHPAFILRQYTPENRRMVWEDLKKAIAKVRGEG